MATSLRPANCARHTARGALRAEAHQLSRVLQSGSGGEEPALTGICPDGISSNSLSFKQELAFTESAQTVRVAKQKSALTGILPQQESALTGICLKGASRYDVYIRGGRVMEKQMHIVREVATLYSGSVSGHENGCSSKLH